MPPRIQKFPNELPKLQVESIHTNRNRGINKKKRAAFQQLLFV